MQERRSNDAKTHFFDDFEDFYKNPSSRSFSAEEQQQGKSFGSSDGFPNFFEGKSKCLVLVTKPNLIFF